jgi:TRAP transporter TAXI family solute receptor
VVFSEQAKAELNNNKVGIVTGVPGGTYNQMGMDLSNVLEDRSTEHPFRVIVMNSVGSVQNLDYLLNLRGVDIAMLQSDVLQTYEHDPQIEAIKQRMQMIAALHREEIHLLGRGGVNDIHQLNGKRVNIGPPGSGTQITVHNLLEKLNINVVADASRPEQAVGKLISGDIDAMFFVVGKPANLFTSIKGEDVQNAVLQFIPLPDQVTGLEQYVPASLTAVDYPGLIVGGTEVHTLAVRSVMAIYAFKRSDNPVRYAALQRFIDRFFDNAGALVERKNQYSPKWCQADLAADVPGWTRFEVAQDWLGKHRSQPIRLCVIAAEGVCPACPSGPLPACEPMARADLAKQGVTVTDFSQGPGKILFDDWVSHHSGMCSR